jgi:hypothetical protein
LYLVESQKPEGYNICSHNFVHDIAAEIPNALKRGRRGNSHGPTSLASISQAPFDSLSGSIAIAIRICGEVRWIVGYQKVQSQALDTLFCLSLKSGEGVEFLFVLTVAALRGLLKIEGPGMACGGVDIDV